MVGGGISQAAVSHWAFEQRLAVIRARAQIPTSPPCLTESPRCCPSLGPGLPVCELSKFPSSAEMAGGCMGFLGPPPQIPINRWLMTTETFSHNSGGQKKEASFLDSS